MQYRAMWALVAALLPVPALAWGPEGHSIVGELAQHRPSPPAAAEVAHLLEPGRSLASVGSWAASDTLAGAGGHDRLKGGTGAGDDGDDRLFAGGGEDIVSGGAGDDVIYGGNGADTVNGDDVIAELLLLYVPDFPYRAGVIAIVLALVAAVKFTGWYPSRSRQ
jgi:hypothetical protein